MIIKEITLDFYDFDKVEALANEAFPPEEYLAPTEIIKMAERREVDFYALYDGELFVGFMVIRIYENMCYLFFLAIDDTHRSKGYGGQALQILDELYTGRQQVVDFEMIDESAANNAQRIVRKKFYMRNGYKETGRFLSYLGVDYEILCKDDEFDFVTFKEMMKSIKIEGFHPSYFEYGK